MATDDAKELVIWVLDDDERQLRTYTALIERSLPRGVGIKVEGLRALPHMQDYLRLLQDPRTACIIADQRLKEAGIADYTGIELAKYLRALNDKLPIYILTNFDAMTEEFSGSEWSVEDILSKKMAGDPKHLSLVVARLLRRIAVYRDILGEREERFRALVRKSLDKALTKAERRELEKLRYFRSSPLLAEELNARDRFTKADELISQLSKLQKDRRLRGPMRTAPKPRKR